MGCVRDNLAVLNDCVAAGGFPVYGDEALIEGPSLVQC